MEDCIFCKIIRGEIPSYKVYETEDIFVMLDINPLSKGHLLVLPKAHYENIHEIPEEILMKVSSVTKEMAAKIKERLNPEGIIIMQNNGRKAGQTIFHAHVHIKPVYEDTIVPREGHLRKPLTEKEFNEICKTLQQHL